jgi:hypothetical protein
VPAARLPPRRARLPELRGQVQRRTSRLRAGLWTIAQTAISVGAAWAIARQLSSSPFFAPISAVVSLAAARGQRTRRAIELVLGVAVGLAVADLIVAALGTSTPVLMLVVALAMGTALLVGGGTLLVSQAGVSAVFVTTVPQSHSWTRVVDALIGGAVALLVSQVLLPRDPVAGVTNAAHELAARLGRALRETAAALDTGDVDRARQALDVARGTDAQLADFADAIEIARETVSVRPPVWRARERLPLYAGAVAQLDYAVRDTRVLARRAVAVARRRGPAPGDLGAAVALLADALDELVRHLDDPAAETSSRRLALDAARRATGVLDEDHGLHTSALIAQIRSTAVDLLRGSGLSEDEATTALEDALEAPAPRQ